MGTADVDRDTTVRGSGKYGIAIGNGDARVVGCQNVAFEDNVEADSYNPETGAPIASCR